MKRLIKGFQQFVNENHMDHEDSNSIARETVATAYSGNSNDDMLRLEFSNLPGKDVLISLDSLADVLDPSVLDSDSDEDLEAVNQALWDRAQEIARRAGCSVLIDNESGEEIDLTQNQLDDMPAYKTKWRYSDKDINEGQGRAHTLLRDIERRAHAGDNSVNTNAELKKLSDEDPAEYKRLLDVGTRTKDRRMEMRYTDKLENNASKLKREGHVMLAFYVNVALGKKYWRHPDDGEYYVTVPEPWINDLAREFCKSDMTVDDLLDAVVDKLVFEVDTTQYPAFSSSQNVSPSAVHTKFKKSFMDAIAKGWNARPAST